MRAIRNGERIINDAKYYADGEEEPEGVANPPMILKQDADFTGLDEGAIEKVREPDVNQYGVEYDNADVKQVRGAPVTKVGSKSTFIVKNSFDGVNPETIDEEKLAMDASKKIPSDDMSKIAFSSGEGDPIFDQAKIDYYKVKDTHQANKFTPTIYDNTSESGYVSDAREEDDDDSEESDDESEETDEDFENSDGDSENSEKKSQDKKLDRDFILNSEDEERIAAQEENLEGRYRYNP
jgi:hypothetical protein